jgi:hypothetical protein
MGKGVKIEVEPSNGFIDNVATPAGSHKGTIKQRSAMGLGDG